MACLLSRPSLLVVPYAKHVFNPVHAPIQPIDFSLKLFNACVCTASLWREAWEAWKQGGARRGLLPAFLFDRHWVKIGWKVHGNTPYA